MSASVVNTVGNLTFHWSKKKVSGSLKQPADLRNLITSLLTSFFKPLELLLELYSKLTFSLVFNFEKDRSSSALWIEKKWQRRRKYAVVSTSVPHGHIGFTVSLKPCLNLCSFK